MPPRRRTSSAGLSPDPRPARRARVVVEEEEEEDPTPYEEEDDDEDDDGDGEGEGEGEGGGRGADWVAPPPGPHDGEEFCKSSTLASFNASTRHFARLVFPGYFIVRPN